MRVVSLWSGGKDSLFAAYKAKLQGHSIISVINFTMPNKMESFSHGLPSRLIYDQARLAGFDIIQKGIRRGVYKDEFKRLIEEYKSLHRIEGIVFGDIYLQEHKDWIDDVCRELGVRAIMPLWGMDTGEIFDEFIDTGFNAICVSVKADILDKDYLGRRLDERFKMDLGDRIDLCGERGEFHTFVISGPIFSRGIEILDTEKILRDGRWYLKIRGWRIDGCLSHHTYTPIE